MNGRIYDQNLGRFISADPFVQFPESTQGYNRYTYVGNNPLSFTDPSGYFLDKLVKAVGIVLNFVPGCQLWCSTIWGAVSGYLMTGSLKGAVIGAVGAAAFHGIGNAFEGVAAFSSGHLQKTLLHGIVGGALSAAGGGRFGDGFLGAASAQLFAPVIDGIGANDDGTLSSDFGPRLGRVVAAAAVGGTAAKLGGGNFGNGAATAAFARLFNDEHTINKQDSDSSKPRRWRLSESEDPVEVTPEPPASDADGWQLEGTLAGNGDRLTIDAGRYIKVELGSNTLGVDAAAVLVTSDPLDAAGNVLPTVRPISPGTNVGGHTGLGMTKSTVLDVGYDSAGGHRWTVRIPLQPSAHGNSAGVWVNVYSWRK